MDEQFTSNMTILSLNVAWNQGFSGLTHEELSAPSSTALSQGSGTLPDFLEADFMRRSAPESAPPVTHGCWSAAAAERRCDGSNRTSYEEGTPTI